MRKIRVLIVDDAVVIRRLLTECLSSDPQIEVVGVAANGQIALAKIPQVNPDIMILDVEMPVIDGLGTLAALRKSSSKLPVIMFSTLTERGASATLDALELGASDYVTKPANVGSVTEAMNRVREELIPRIKQLCSFCRQIAPRPTAPPEVRPRASAPADSRGRLVVIAVSTGGPNALSTLMPLIGRPLLAPILIVQHMPPLFTRMLAERLEAVSGLRVREGVDAASVKTGDVWLAPGGHHMEVKRFSNELRLSIHDGPPENSCRPAADVLFRSAAELTGVTALAVVLTGMGHDGLRGCERIHDAGGMAIVQDQASSVVWGMPGAVAQAGLADKVLPLSGLANEINRFVKGTLPQAVHQGSPQTCCAL